MTLTRQDELELRLDAIEYQLAHGLWDDEHERSILRQRQIQLLDELDKS